MTTKRERKTKNLYDRFNALMNKSEYHIEGNVEENHIGNGIYVKPYLITSPAFADIQREFTDAHIIFIEEGIQIFD